MKRKKKIVSYAFTDKHGSGYGRCEVLIPLKETKDLKMVEDALKKVKELKEVTIISVFTL